MKRRVAVLTAAAILAAACSKETAKQTTQNVKKKVQDVFEVSAPMGRPDAPDVAQQRERERFDQQWRALQSFRAEQAAKQAAAQQLAAQQQAAQQAQINFVTGQKQSFKGLDANGINAAPVNIPITGDVKGPSVLRAQVLLDRAHFSVGAIDGRWGRNSAVAVWLWQRAHGMAPSGDVDEATFRSLAAAGENVQPVVQYTLTADDVKGPFVHVPDDVYEKQNLSCLCYESLREKLAERFHSAEDFLELLNPDVKFSELQAGATINVPNVRPPFTNDQKDIAKVVISIAGNSFNAFDAAGNMVFHAPSTLGAGYDPSPDETLHVVKIVPDPHFHYDPTLYHEVPDSEPDAHLPPGPNSPVGIVWIALSKEHYGVHGTNDPEAIGYASSHGCVRLTNWDAQEVEHRISEGVQVAFIDNRTKG
jgi:lipoprotein-anchoring transpeptidase ErfK/SrfK